VQVVKSEGIPKIIQKMYLISEVSFKEWRCTIW